VPATHASWQGLALPSTSFLDGCGKDVDGRDTPDHDGLN
jgi:hypothetical protein